ncbi:MAG TPA: hypothetical protein VI432_00205 [Candidatus Paceibacterota bacterium]
MGNADTVLRLKKSAAENNGCEKWNAWWIEILIELNGREKVLSLIKNPSGTIVRENINWDKFMELLNSQNIIAPKIDIRGGNFLSLSLEGAILVGARANEASFRDMAHAICIGMEAPESSWRKANGADLRLAVIKSAVFLGDNIGMRTDGAKMDFADFSRVNDPPADLPETAIAPPWLNGTKSREPQGYGTRDEITNSRFH